MLPAAVLIWDEPNLRKQSPAPDKAGNDRRALPPKRRTLPQASGATLRCALAGRCRSSTAMFPMLKITVPPDDRGVVGNQSVRVMQKITLPDPEHGVVADHFYALGPHVDTMLGGPRRITGRGQILWREEQRRD